MKLFTQEQAHPIALLRVLSVQYGVEWMQWPRAVLRQTLELDFDITPARINLDKAMAAAAVATRDAFWKDWEHFHFLAQALNNTVPSAGDLQELSVGQMMVAVDIASEIRKSLKTLSHVPQFSEDVRRFIAAQAKNQGIWYLPAPLAFAAPLAAGKWYRCRECGNESEVVFEDGVCDACSERFLSAVHQVTSWTPNPNYLPEAQNIEYFEKNPTAGVKKRLDQILAGRDLTLQEKRDDVCVAKLLVAMKYLNHRREQLRGQQEAA